MFLLSFLFFFSKQYRERTKEGGSVPLSKGINKRDWVEMGMHSEKHPDATHFATWWAQKLALLMIFLASQEERAGIEDKISEIMGEIFQSKMRLGYERLVITIREAANRAARRAAKASPVLGSQGGEISITVWIIRPPEFQQTAA